MKPEKKSSAAKKAAAPKSAAKESTKKIAAKPAPEPEKAKASPAKRAVKKAASKIVEAVERAADTTRKAAGSVQRAATKAEKITKEVVVKAAERVAAPKPPAKRKVLKIPAILLEGDKPSAPPISGPGQRYALGPTPPVEHFAEIQELPEAYGTQKLLLTARDPYWLYAHWDFTREQLNKYNALSADGHLVLRIYVDAISSTPITQIHVHPESRNWFAHVGKGGTKYMAELGYYDRAGRWHQVSVSGATITPPDTLSEDVSVRFATIPVDVPFEELIRLVKAAVSENVPLAKAIQQLRAHSVDLDH